MSNGVTFFFQGKDNTTKVFKNIDKSMKSFDKSVKNLQKSIKTLSSVISTSLGVIKRVVGTAINLIVGIVKKGISLIKNLVTGAFNFVRSALSTLLSWTTKALGKVFDGIGTLISKSAQTAVKAGKTAVKTVISSIQAYADKEYNSIQLQVSLRGDFEQVNRDFKELLRYTTADRNDLWSTMATYAEMGKTAKDITKYTRATIYLANATGKSLDSITSMLLTQEALSRDVEKTLKNYGVNISGVKDDISVIDKIITAMGPEMEALANNSLAQSFANVKNDLIGIKEMIGSIFAGPVKKVADMIDDLLKRILGKDSTKWAEKIDALFEKVRPFLEKVFNFLAKVVQDPEGFLKALWADIKTVFANIRKNLSTYVAIIGTVLGQLFGKVLEYLKEIDFKELKVAFGDMAGALEDFILNFGKGAGWFDETETSLKNAIINAWNSAEHSIKLDPNAGIWQNIQNMFKSIWDDSIKPKIDELVEKWKTYIFPNLIESFKLLGQVLITAINNALADSPIIDLINKIPGVNIGKPKDTAKYQQELYNALQTLGFLDKMGITDPSQITKAWLDAENTWDKKYGKTYRDAISTILSIQRTGGADLALAAAGAVIGTVATGGALAGVGASLGVTTAGSLVGGAAGGYVGYGMGGGLSDSGYTFIPEEALDALHSLEQYDHILVKQEYPDIIEALANIWKSTDSTTEAVEENYKQGPGPISPDAYKNLYENFDDISENVKTIADTITTGLTVSAINGQVALPIWTAGGAGGGGGIQDYFATSNEFRIRPFSSGGWAGLHGPEIALLGENGPEYVVPNSQISRTTGGGGINSSSDMHLNNNGTWYSTTLIEKLLISLGISTDLLDELVSDLDPLITPATSALQKWSDETVLEDSIKTGLKWEISLVVPWYKKIWNGIKGFGKGVAGYLGTTVGFLGKNGAFGSHIGNIMSGIMQQQENGTLSIWTALGEVVKEFLPYLQKGLELVGGIFDQAFEIAGNAVMNLGEEIGQTLMPILEAFIPFMKTLSDVIIALAPVVSSTLAPAVKIIALILNILTGLLDGLMPVIAAFSAVIQWVSDAISYAIGSVINWLASWIPWIQSTDVKKPKSVPDYYWDIMDSYNESKANGVTGISTTAVGTASQTASYSGATTIHIHNDFNGSYIVGQGGMRDLALIIKQTLEDVDYTGQTV